MVDTKIYRRGTLFAVSGLRSFERVEFTEHSPGQLTSITAADFKEGIGQLQTGLEAMVFAATSRKEREERGRETTRTIIGYFFRPSQNGLMMAAYEPSHFKATIFGIKGCARTERGGQERIILPMGNRFAEELIDDAGSQERIINLSTAPAPASYIPMLARAGEVSVASLPCINAVAGKLGAYYANRIAQQGETSAVIDRLTEEELFRGLVAEEKEQFYRGELVDVRIMSIQHTFISLKELPTQPSGHARNVLHGKTFKEYQDIPDEQLTA